MVLRIASKRARQELRDGRLRVEFTSRQQQDAVTRLVREIANDRRITMRDNTRPKFMLTGVMTGYSGGRAGQYDI